MTLRRPALLLVPLVIASGLAVASPAAADDTYHSTPPPLVEAAEPAAPAERAKPKPPPTSGFVTGRVIGPGGKPVKQGLVYGVRFSDLGLPVDFSEEERVATRTTANGFFRLPQLTEPYLVRVCAAEAGAVECSTDPVVKTFAPSYIGPDGTTVSWLRQSAMFPPRKPSRSIGSVTVKASAVLAGTFRGGENQTVYLLRGDDSIADRAFTDEKGKYRFEVAGGTYRIEVDRDPGLRNDYTVPGFRSDKLKLKPGRIKYVSFRTRHAGVVRGFVTAGGLPVPDTFLAILDANEQFAAGVVTDATGRYEVTSLKPGSYTIRTSVSADYVSQTKPVTLAQTVAQSVDFALEAGATVRFSATDSIFPGGDGDIVAELRNQAGRVMKVYQGNPAQEPGGEVVFRGLPPEQYKLYVRRAAFPLAPPEETVFPWAQRSLDTTLAVETNFGPIALDQASIDLSGTLDKGSQVKITAIPQDPWLREAHEVGDQVTPMALAWTERATSAGTYTAHGLVPGTYSVLQTTAYKDRGNKPTATGSNVATTLHTVTVTGGPTSASFAAPRGASVKGTMEYNNGRPVIAPIGLRVYDAGPASWLFPTVSGKQKLGKPFRVERLHVGDAVGRLLDLEELYAEHPDVLIPDSLVSSARLAETGTPYWLIAKAERFTLRAGKVLDLGVIKVLVRGLDPNSR